MRKCHREMVRKFFYDKKVGLKAILYQQFPNDCKPHINLICAVMEQALKEGDREYILGKGLKYHCKILNLTHYKIRWMMYNMHKKIIKNIEWKEN